MSDTSERNNQIKAAMRQTGTAPPLNNGPAQVPCSPRQAPVTNRPTNHIEPGTGKRS